MTPLDNLRDAETLDDIARILGFTSKALTYILYKMPSGLKYRVFEIPKRSGGKRQIKAPEPKLALLQRRLARLLYDCLAEIEKSNPHRRRLAHGFERNRSIYTNATLHKRRRYVLNLDLKDFFPSFNFGRVRGFFMKDKHFALKEKIATIIAQIACHENELPQGSPCSPVISNLIGHLLDARLARFAKAHKCTYSRYADDITFSTNRKNFPAELSTPVSGSASGWQLGIPLITKIEHSGFEINNRKTRMQCRGSRQVATGLVVNEKVNIRPEFYRTARAMCHALFSFGNYYRLVPAVINGGAPGDAPVKKSIVSSAPLQGILAHIHSVKNRTDQRSPKEKKQMPSSACRLYGRFLFYKNFVAVEAPLILPEGKTDTIYLRNAIRKLPVYHPQLGAFKDGRFVLKVRFMNYSRTTHEVLHLGGGTGDLKPFIAKYHNTVSGFKHKPLAHPVIVVVDNDDGATDLFSFCKKNGVPNISHASTDLFYHLGANLYLVKIPGIGADHKSRIEDFFDPVLLATEIDGKKFDPDKEHGDGGKYGKHIFAEKVIKPNVGTIDFSKFASLLDRIVAALNHYDALRAA